MIDSITRGYYLEMGLLMVLLSTVGKIFHSFLINHSSIFNTNNFNSSLRAYNYKQRHFYVTKYCIALHAMQMNKYLNIHFGQTYTPALISFKF